jgi:hypothetical protein
MRNLRGSWARLGITHREETGVSESGGLAKTLAIPWLVAGIFAALIILPAQPASAATSYSCAYAPATDPGAAGLGSGNYPEPRVWVEAQGWWQEQLFQPLDQFPGRHLHIGACMPLENLPQHPVISGRMRLNWRIVAHAQPAGFLLKHAFVQIATINSQGGQIRLVDGVSTPRPCTGDCTWWFSAEVDTALSDRDGKQEFRFLTISEQPDGNEQHASTGWQVNLDNGDPHADYRSSLFVEGRGWYSISSPTTGGYAIARLTNSGLPGNTQPTPATPVPSVWTTSWKLAPGSDGPLTTGVACNVDPNFHTSPPDHGTVVRTGTSQYTGTVTVNTSGLAPGTHRLVCRSDSRHQGPSVSGINSGVQVIWFTK